MQCGEGKGADSRALGPAGAAARDRATLAGLAAGDPAAFAAVFESYYDALCAFAEGYAGSADEAEDVVTEVFARLWERRGQLAVRLSLKTYLYSATRNQALNHRRREGSERRRRDGARLVGALPGQGVVGARVLEELHAAELRQAIDAAIQRLPERRRAVFVLHRRHGLSYGEIAEVLGISLKTVENHMGLALRDLRDQLAPSILD